MWFKFLLLAVPAALAFGGASCSEYVFDVTRVTSLASP
jgi:hypothetical protein